MNFSLFELDIFNYFIYNKTVFLTLLNFYSTIFVLMFVEFKNNYIFMKYHISFRDLNILKLSIIKYKIII